MGAFALLRGVGAEIDRRAEEIDRLFARQGFGNRRTLRLAGWTLVLCAKMNTPDENLHVIDEQNFSFATGTFLYRERIGVPALQAYREDRAAGGIDWDEAWGCYFLLSAVDGQLRAHLDPLGSYKVYASSDGAFYSSSFLAATHLATKRKLDRHGVYQYVFEGATFGRRTLFEQISLFPSGIVRDLDSLADTPIETGIVAAFDRSTPLPRHVESTLGVLRRYFGTLTRVFGDRIDTALSGGYDSRLMLALLLEQGRAPRVHVYGRPTDADVKIARAIAAGEQFALEAVDKTASRPLAAHEFPAVIERNFYAFDGTPNDGIFDNGADIATRRERCAHGELMLNGGGGEVFRNFFYLPDRPFTPRELLWTFYTQFDPRVGTELFSESGYHEVLAEVIRSDTGVVGDCLDRAAVEYLYPVFRCRYWTGRNTSINNRFGYALTPFIERAVVRSALRVPLHLKQHGRFESALIKSAFARLASYASEYGHDFQGAPPITRRAKDWATLLRPPVLRRFSYRLQRRLRRAAPPPYFLAPEYRRATLPEGFPQMSRFFRVERMSDWQQFNRVCTLEYLLRAYPANG